MGGIAGERCLRIAGLSFAVVSEYTLYVMLLGQHLFTRQDLRVDVYLKACTSNTKVVQKKKKL